MEFNSKQTKYKIGKPPDQFKQHPAADFQPNKYWE